MYTVIRVTSAGDSSKLHEAVQTISVGRSRQHLEPRHRGDGYAAVLCRTPSWVEHAAAVLDFVQANRAALLTAHSAGALVTVDVGVEPEDRSLTGWSEITLLPELLGELSAARATLVVTLYAGADVVEDDAEQH